jgi:phage minor structural protein
MTYQVWAFTNAGAKAAYLQNAFNIQRTEKVNQTPTLSFSLPADDAKAVFLTSAYDVKIWNTVKDRWEGLYILREATEKWDSSGSIVEVYYTGAMIQLAEEENISYDTTATPKTPTQIVTALLALQEHVPAITVGTIQPTTSFAFAIENTNLLAALLKCVEYLGGYMEVDADRHLNWYNEPSGSPVREIRYQKNMKGVTRKRDFTNIVNKVYAYGYGETEAQVTLIDAGETYEYIENVPSQTAYGVKIKRITDKRITHPSTLLLWAQKYLADNKDPVYYYTVDVVNLAEHRDFDFDFEEFTVGQIVRVVNSDMNNLLVNVKIVSVDTNLSKPEEISLELANATKDLSDSFAKASDTRAVVQNMAVQIGAGQVTVQGIFTVDGWRTAGVTTIDGGQITADTISCTALKTSTLNAKTITLGTTGGNGVIQSVNFVAGTSGFQILGDGNAEFNNVTVRGTLGATNIVAGASLVVNGDIKSANYVIGSTGWKITGTGAIYAENISVVSEITAGWLVAGSTKTPLCYISKIGSPTIYGSIETTNGVALVWRDKDGNVHTISMT